MSNDPLETQVEATTERHEEENAEPTREPASVMLNHSSLVQISCRQDVTEDPSEAQVQATTDFLEEKTETTTVSSADHVHAAATAVVVEAPAACDDPMQEAGAESPSIESQEAESKNEVETKTSEDATVKAKPCSEVQTEASKACSLHASEVLHYRAIAAEEGDWGGDEANADSQLPSESTLSREDDSSVVEPRPAESSQAANGSKDASSDPDKHQKRSRSQSTPIASLLAEVPTASRRRLADSQAWSNHDKETCDSSQPSMISARDIERSRSPRSRWQSVAGQGRPVAEQETSRRVKEELCDTPSKFGSIYEKLRAKAEAKDRGENVSSSWTPRASLQRVISTPRGEIPMRSWQTPPHHLSSSPAIPTRLKVEEIPAEQAGYYRTAPASPAVLPAPATATPQEIKSSLVNDRKRMLEELTERMKVCLSRLQDHNLDEKQVEKYQDMAKKLRIQMDKIGSIQASESCSSTSSTPMRSTNMRSTPMRSAPIQSPASGRAPGLLCPRC
jgi:hypothetical protein